MNSNGTLATFTNFQNILHMPDYKEHTCYLIQVIQKSPLNDVPWKVAQRGVQENIRIIGAPYVYRLATRRDDAFPAVLRAVVEILEAKHGMLFDGEDEASLGEILAHAPGFTL